MPERLQFLWRPGPWFWAVVAVGALLRVFLAVATRGTSDAEIWSDHAMRVATVGLVEHYAEDPMFNHPPFISEVMAWLFALAQATGVEFRVLYRLVFIPFDLANVWLLTLVLRRTPWRFVAAAAYAVAPVALTLSGMHGNTDPLIATCLLAACLCVDARQPVLAGFAIGLGAWIKLPGLLAAPALWFALPRWRDRATCAVTALVVATSTYLFALAAAPQLLGARVFGYRGLFIHTLHTPPIWVWGFKSWFIRLWGPPGAWPSPVLWYTENSQWIAIALMLLLAFLRRRENDARGIAVTIAATFALFYGLVETWTFQYFAWSMPFWFAAGLPYALCANLFGGGYLYALYVYVCGDLLLRPRWAFDTAPPWPMSLILQRDLAHLTFFAFGVLWLVRAIHAEARARSGSPRGPGR